MLEQCFMALPPIEQLYHHKAGAVTVRKGFY
jgi:hypothetical protein